jgi:hypothetical protein
MGGLNINIKPENKGKFTASAERAGEGVQQHAKEVVGNPSVSETQRKRAQFAINSRKFKHGGKKNG